MPSSKLTPELAERLAREISEGLPNDYACDIVGIGYSTYCKWMNVGAEDVARERETEYSAFYELMRKSYATFIRDSKIRIRKGEPGWQGVAWWLERTNSRFIPKQQVQGDEEGKVTVVIGGKRIAQKGTVRIGDKKENDG